MRKIYQCIARVWECLRLYHIVNIIHRHFRQRVLSAIWTPEKMSVKYCSSVSNLILILHVCQAIALHVV